jgi:hypothetical protein
VLYDDGEIEQLNMAKEKWERIESNGSSKKVDCSFLEIISNSKHQCFTHYRLTACLQQQKKGLPGTNQGR